MARSRVVPVSPARLLSVQTYSGPSIDGDMSPQCRSRLAGKGDRDQIVPLGRQRGEMVLDRVDTECGGSRVRSFDGASPHGWASRSSLLGGVNARTRVSQHSHVDVAEEEKKHMGYDPAAVPRHQCSIGHGGPGPGPGTDSTCMGPTESVLSREGMQEVFDVARSHCWRCVCKRGWSGFSASTRVWSRSRSRRWSDSLSNVCATSRRHRADDDDDWYGDRGGAEPSY